MVWHWHSHLCAWSAVYLVTWYFSPICIYYKFHVPIGPFGTKDVSTDSVLSAIPKRLEDRESFSCRRFSVLEYKNCFLLAQIWIFSSRGSLCFTVSEVRLSVMFFSSPQKGLGPAGITLMLFLQIHRLFHSLPYKGTLKPSKEPRCWLIDIIALRHSQDIRNS